MESHGTYTAFEGDKLFSHGSLAEVVTKIKKRLGKAQNAPMLIFSDATGATIDFNFQGTEKEIAKRLAVFVAGKSPRPTEGPGRPRLGVVSREISLLPRHWEWLATQPGGASATLRRLVEDGAKRAVGSTSTKQAQERAHKFMSSVAGDRPGYEEALRALYRRDRKGFSTQIASWPEDLQGYVQKLAKSAFAND